MTNTVANTTFYATRQVGQKYYELKDHLGNVRAVVTDRKLAGNDVEVKSASNYYPFGMFHPENCAFSEDYRFGFNGKEMDNDLGHGTGNMYDYGFRIYNPRIAKFLSVDPLTGKYPWYTPYQFAGNTPIRALDLDGLEILDFRAMYSLHLYNTISTLKFDIKLEQGSTLSNVNEQLENNIIYSKEKDNSINVGVFVIDEKYLEYVRSLPISRQNIEVVFDPNMEYIDNRINEVKNGNGEHMNKVPIEGDYLEPASASDKNIKTIDTYNKQQAKSAVIAWGIERGTLFVWSFTDSYADIIGNENINIQQDAFRIASSYTMKYRDQFLANYGKYADLILKEVTEYVVDGRVPNFSTEWDSFIKDLGDNILNENSELNMKIQLKTVDHF